MDIRRQATASQRTVLVRTVSTSNTSEESLKSLKLATTRCEVKRGRDRVEASIRKRLAFQSAAHTTKAETDSTEERRDPPPGITPCGSGPCHVRPIAPPGRRARRRAIPTSTSCRRNEDTRERWSECSSTIPTTNFEGDLLAAATLVLAHSAQLSSCSVSKQISLITVRRILSLSCSYRLALRVL